MKNLNLLTVVLLGFILFSCDEETVEIPFTIEGITTENYPKVDASTAAAPLQNLIACKLLGFRYNWEQAFDGTYTIYPNWEDIPANFDYFERIKTSKTHDAIMNIIDKKVDFILSVRKMSGDEQAHAEEQGVTLIETPVALDAFIFIVNRSNPIKSLTIKQIQDIYTGDLTNWKEVGGKDAQINPYVRNANSGSQELMESLVMKGLKIKDLPEESMLGGMMPVFSTVMTDVNSICYSLYYYNAQMVKENIAKAIAVDRVTPDKNTIKKRTYPFTAEVYAVIRSDLDKSSMAYKIYESLQSAAGKHLIDESGYVSLQ
ncbi:MAG: substrate-binding domain-containing protein [Dysgonamonadaceae bacterium]|jgi:phosphate transport system substrate-binding protein|nr:substrate-binding domain-containing protein [Dysgonamonadaceae bacterium]